MVESGKIFADHQETAAMPHEDGGNAVDLNPLYWDKLTERLERHSPNYPAENEITVYPFLDITSAKSPLIIPPNIDIELSLVPNNPKQALIVTRPERGEPVVELLRIQAILPRIVPTAAHPPKSLIRHQFMRTRALPLFIPKDTTNYSTLATLNGGPLASRLSVVFLSMDAFDGNYTANMYASPPHNVQQISFSVAGKRYPGVDVTAGFDEDKTTALYALTSESLRFSLAATGQSLPPLSQYAVNRFIFSQDTSRDFSADSSWLTNPDRGSVSVDIRFSRKTSEPIIALLITETISTLSIDAQRTVTVT